MKLSEPKVGFKQPKKGSILNHPAFPDLTEIPMPEKGMPQKLSVMGGKLPTIDFSKMKKSPMVSMGREVKSPKMASFTLGGTTKALPLSKKAEMLSGASTTGMPKDISFSMPRGSTTMDTAKFESMMGLGHGVTAEKDANERVKQQLGLPMWGDKDKDGVPNILDCWPMDRKRQGPENDMDDEGATVDEEGRPSGTFRRGRTDSEGEDLFREARKKTGRAETSEEIPSEWYTLPYPVEPEASVSYGNEPEVTVTFPEEREPSTTTQLTSYAKRLIKEKFRTPEEKEIARLEKIKEGGQGYVTLKRAQILAEEATKRERIRQARGKPQFMIGTGQAALSGLPPPTGIGAMQTAQIAGTGAGIGQFAMIPGASTGGAGFAQMTPQQAAGGMGFAQMTGGGWPQLPTGGGLDTSVPTGQAIDVPAAQEIAPPTASLVPSAPKRQVIARSTNVCPEGMVYSQRSRRCVRFERGPYRKTQQ